MSHYLLRKLLYNIPVYLGILLIVMASLRVNDPIWAFLGKQPTREQYDRFAAAAGLDRPLIVQFARLIQDVVTFDFSVESWDQPGVEVGWMIRRAVVPSLALTLPALLLTTCAASSVGLLSARYRGLWIDRLLVILAVVGMSVSFLVYIILGQYFGAFRLSQVAGHEVFAIEGYEPGLGNWVHYCLLPVLISTTVALGYDARFYRAVMVEEATRDHITTARAKGASPRRILLLHLLKNAMIPVVTRVAMTIPFLITGSILLETYFGIPGMGRTLILAVTANDFPVIQGFTAVFAALYIASNILTDVAYALVDPRVRLS
jgi:peptide/nickel transport system permease protein